MIQKLSKSQIDKTNLVNNDNSINIKNKKVIDAITVKLKNNKSNSKERNLDGKVKSNPNDSNVSDTSNNSFEDMLLHSDKRKIELFKKNRLKELKNKTDQENYKFTHKPLTEINGLITELSGLFVKPKNLDSQFANNSKDKFIDMIFDNFEDLIDTKENINSTDVSKNVNIIESLNTNLNEALNQVSNTLYTKLENKSGNSTNLNSNTTTNTNLSQLKETKLNTNLKEFNPDNYDILNPLSELSKSEFPNNKLTNIELLGKEINKSNVIESSNDIINIKDNLKDNNVLSEVNNPKNLKYNLKDLISLIKNAIENDNNIQKSEIVSNINSILISQSKDNSLLDINQKRISDLVNKNTNEMVNEFLPKYFFKSGNSKTKNISPDINNSNFKIQSDNLSNNELDNYINEIDKLEQKLNKISDKSSLTSNILSFDGKKHNIILSGESKPTNETKTNENEKGLLVNKEKINIKSDLPNKLNNNINSIDDYKFNSPKVADKKHNIVLTGESKPINETKTNEHENGLLVSKEKIKENNTDNSDKSPNFNQNLNLESNKISSINNIIKRANSIEFQSFNNVGLNELNSTTTTATIKTPESSTSMVRITMNPNSLGTVFVEIKMNGDEASINFKTVDKEVLSTLENNIKDLQASLKSENIELKSLIIDYKDYDKELNQENSARNQEEQNNKDKKQENKNLYKDLSNNKQDGINLDSDFYNNLKNYAEQFRENSTIYKDVTNRNSNLENLKIKTKIIEKYS